MVSSVSRSLQAGNHTQSVDMFLPTKCSLLLSSRCSLAYENKLSVSVQLPLDKTSQKLTLLLILIGNLAGSLRREAKD